MSSMAQKMQSNKRGAGGGGKEDTYISSKEDKEAMLNRKMEEIRRKNEALKKRHEMIQADRIAAEKSGQAINLKQAATSEPLPPHKPQMRGTYADNDGSEGRKSKFAAGRGKRLANRSKEELRAQNYEVKPRSEGNSPGSKQSSGSGRTQEPKSPSDGPPPDPGYSFLADRSREGPLPESRGGRKEQYERDSRGDRTSGGGGRRHPRNFGGGDFSNVKQKIQHDRYSQGKPRGSVKSDMDMQLHMTGKERREYVEWKKEREKIDMIRMERQKTAEGDWRREWDREKDEQAFDSTPAPPMSRHIEPARRPAGRIGSGRFDRGDDERAAGPGYEPEDRIERGAERGSERGGARGFRGGRGERGGRGGPGRGGRGGSSGERGGGRGGGRGGRRPEEKQRTYSTGSDDRSVEEQNDSLLIKVDNEFAQRGGRGGRGAGRGAKKWGGRSGPPERTGDPKQKESWDDDSRNQEKTDAKDDQVPKSEERKFRLGAPRGARNKKAVGSGRIGSGRLAASHDDEEVIIEDEEGNQTRRHLNSSSGSAGEWETDTSSQSLTADGDEHSHNAEEDDYWEDDEEFYKFQSTELDEDLRNSSLESFDDSSFHRFIEKNTLRIDAKTGLPTRDKSGQHIPPGAVPVTPTSPDPTSPLHSLKTPTDHKKILDWGAEMDALSPAGSKSGTNSSQSPNESPKRKQNKGDDENISISDHDDSVNTSTEAKRQIIFPEEDEDKPEKLETKGATVETATDQTEPEEKRGQVDEKDETRQDTNNSSDIEDKESNLPTDVEDETVKVEKKVEGVGTASKEDGDEEDDEFEDAAEDEEGDEFVDAGSNVATPLARSREVSAEPTPQTSPQHKASVKRQEDGLHDDSDVINEETEENKSHDNDVINKENEDNNSSDNGVISKETEDTKSSDIDIINKETEDNDNDVINEETENKGNTDFTQEDLAQKPDDVTEVIGEAESKSDETKPNSDDTKDVKDDTTSENLETSDKDDPKDSSRVEEEKSVEQQSDFVGETNGANVNNTVTPPTDGTEETASSPPQDGDTVDKSQSETEFTDSVNKQTDDTTAQPKTDIDTSDGNSEEKAEAEIPGESENSKEEPVVDTKPESS